MSKTADSIRRGLEEAVAYARGEAKESAYHVHRKMVAADAAAQIRGKGAKRAKQNGSTSSRRSRPPGKP